MHSGYSRAGGATGLRLSCQSVSLEVQLTEERHFSNKAFRPAERPGRRDVHCLAYYLYTWSWDDLSVRAFMAVCLLWLWNRVCFQTVSFVISERGGITLNEGSNSPKIFFRSSALKKYHLLACVRAGSPLLVSASSEWLASLKEKSAEPLLVL